MNWKNRKLDWRLTIVLFFVLFSTLYGFFLFFVPKKNAPTQPTISSPQNSLSPTEPIKKKNEMKTLTTSFFTIQHPTDWNVEVYKTTTGQSIIVRPQNLLGTPEFYPSLNIDISPASESETLLRDRKKLYADFGLREDSITLDGVKGVKLAGTLPYKVVSGKSFPTPTQESLIFLTKSNLEYGLKYHYEGDKSNSDYEELFGKMISSFSFIQ